VEVHVTYSTPEKFEFPILQWDPAKKLWRLTEDYTFEWVNKKGIRCRRTIKKGTEYDKASVPRPLWGLARTDGPWEPSSLLHDDEYKQCQHGGTFEPGSYQQFINGTWVDVPKMSRWDSDELLEYVGVLGGATPAEASEYKWAVRLYPENWLKGF